MPVRPSPGRSLCRWFGNPQTLCNWAEGLWPLQRQPEAGFPWGYLVPCRAVLKGPKKKRPSQRQQKRTFTGDALCFMVMVPSPLQGLAVGGWWLVAVGGWWRLVAVGGRWGLAVSSWRQLAVDGWRLAAVGGSRLVVPGGCP